MTASRSVEAGDTAEGQNTACLAAAVLHVDDRYAVVTAAAHCKSVTLYGTCKAALGSPSTLLTVDHAADSGHAAAVFGEHNAGYL